jgi:hypothetical protein
MKRKKIISFLFLGLAFVEVPVLAESDLGDAPDSSNSYGLSMTAYPLGGPPGVVANFSTVYEAGSPPYGPRHNDALGRFYLGATVSLETEADLGPDDDGTNNISPPSDVPNTDAADDSVIFPLSLQPCTPSTFKYVVTALPDVSGQTLFINAWFDWNRDGDWGDSETCGATGLAPEWAVQNQVLVLTAPGTYLIDTPLFLSYHPSTSEASAPPLWMRITVSEQPLAGNADGSGPVGGYSYGETEDYYLIESESYHFESISNPSIDGIRSFFDDAVAMGTLGGNGTTATSSDGKLTAFANMLAQADALIGIGDLQGACTQLLAAYAKVDGLTPPPDFVTGPAIEDLAEMIQDLMDSLGCVQ